MTGERPPAILQIHRDTLKPGSEAAFKAVEEDAARVCAELNCPHPHLALESLNGPKEVWWLNGYESEAEKQRVSDDYAKNGPLMAALGRIVQGREGLIATEVDIFANHRPDLSRGAAWALGGARFFVVTVTGQDPLPEGSVFETPDGTRFVFSALDTRVDADAAADAIGPEATVFAVRPYWGMPAKEWIAADPELWKSNPMASRR